MIHRSPDAPVVKVPAAAAKPAPTAARPKPGAEARAEARGRKAEGRPPRRSPRPSQGGERQEAKAKARRQEARQAGEASREAARSAAEEAPLGHAVPFLRLTRDRRGFENTFLHARRSPGRSAAAAVLVSHGAGHPARPRAARRRRDPHDRRAASRHRLRLAGDPRAERGDDAGRRGAGAAPQQQQPPRQQTARPRDRERSRDDRAADAPASRRPPLGETPATTPRRVEPVEAAEPMASRAPTSRADADDIAAPPRHTYGLLEELVGREIATRLRARLFGDHRRAFTSVMPTARRATRG